MNTTSKRPALIPALLVLATALILGFFLSIALHRSGREQPSWEEKTHSVNQAFTELNLNCGSRDLRILPSDDGVCSLTAMETATQHWQVEVRNGVLTLTWTDERSAAERMLPDPAESWRTAELRLPGAKLESCVGESGSGDLTAEELSFGLLDLKTGSGSLTVKKLEAEELYMKSGSGDQRLEDLRIRGSFNVQSGSGSVSASLISADSGSFLSGSGDQELESIQIRDSFSAETGSGDLRLDGLEAGTASLKSTSGTQKLADLQVSGELKGESGSGDITFDRLSVGSASLRTDSGSVKGTVRGEMDYQVETGSGGVSLPESRSGAGVFRVKTGSGDVRIQSV